MPADALEHLIGLQAQNTLPPYMALWSRLEGFEAEALSAMIRDRRAVRLALMRSTIHLVTARDCLRLRPMLQAMIEHHFHTGSPFGRRLKGLDFEQLAAAAKKLMPCSTNEAGKLLQQQFPKYDAEALGQAARTWLALVQLPPRGIWGEGGMATCDTAEHLLGKPQKAGKLDDLVLRYLGAFGPATPRDFQRWGGVRGTTFDHLRDRLVTFQDEEGRELFDLPDAPRPEEDVEAPPRFLGEYDNLALAHVDRSRVIADGAAKAFAPGPAVKMPAMIDGFVAATWTHAKGRVKVVPFRKLTARLRAKLDDEADRLSAFLQR